MARRPTAPPTRLYRALRDQLGSIRGVYLRSNRLVRRNDFASFDETVLLLNGFFQTRTVWEIMEDRLRSDGYGVLSFDLGGVLWRYQVRSITEQASMIADKIEGICERTGLERFHIVGHSMGGLLARQYIQHKGGDRRVKSLTTLGTPHHGTPTALVGLGVTGLGLISDSASQMLPGSRFLKRLQRTPWPAQIPLTSVYSRHDMVCPSWCSTLRPRPGESSMENRPVRGIGHTGLCHDPGVYRIVRTELEKAARLWNERDGLHEP